MKMKMKLTKIFVIISMILIMMITTVGIVIAAPIEPTVLNDTTDPNINGWDDQVCMSDSNTIYCVGGDKNSRNLTTYVPGTTTFTDLGNVTTNTISNQGEGCWLFSGRIYCRGIGSNNPVESFLLNGSDHQNHASLVTANQMACDLRPGTDEAYCYDEVGTLRRYDIGDDTWTDLADIVPVNPSSQVLRNSCIFRDSSEMWCLGGSQKPTTANTVFEIMVYNVVTNISDQTRNVTVGLMEYRDPHCLWHTNIDEYLYCTAGESFSDPDLINNSIWFYNAGNDSQGLLSNKLIIDTALPGSGVINNTMYLIGGFITTGFDQGELVQSLIFGSEVPPPVPPEPPLLTGAAGNLVGLFPLIVASIGIIVILFGINLLIFTSKTLLGITLAIIGSVITIVGSTIVQLVISTFV